MQRLHFNILEKWKLESEKQNEWKRKETTYSVHINSDSKERLASVAKVYTVYMWWYICCCGAVVVSEFDCVQVPHFNLFVWVIACL